MELFSNSLAAYAHIRGEGRAWEHRARPSWHRQPSTPSCSPPSPTPRFLSPAALPFCAPSLDSGSLPDGTTPACQAPL